MGTLLIESGVSWVMSKVSNINGPSQEEPFPKRVDAITSAESEFLINFD